MGKAESRQYFEEHDLSHLDGDETVLTMLLSGEEVRAKTKLFEVCNPDWLKVKKDMDRRAMIKEEKQAQRKRKLDDTYKTDPHEFVAGKVKKRFRSAKTDPEAYYRLTGQRPATTQTQEMSPAVTIK